MKWASAFFKGGVFARTLKWLWYAFLIIGRFLILIYFPQSYYTVAAKLGDADAQHDLGFCLANGKGCKKDRKEAAKWHRAAVSLPQLLVFPPIVF